MSSYCLRCKNMQLIYFNCNFDLEDILLHLQFLFMERNVIIQSHIITTDNDNIYLYISLNKSISIKDITFFDIDCIDKRYHPIVNMTRCEKYIKSIVKDNKYISNIM
jgi:hypothetical protein